MLINSFRDTREKQCTAIWKHIPVANIFVIQGAIELKACSFFIWPLSQKSLGDPEVYLNNLLEACPGNFQTSMMELFREIVNDFYRSSIFAKIFVIAVWQGPRYAFVTSFLQCLKNFTNFKILKNRGKPGKLREISRKIIALRKNSGKIFKLLFKLLIL